MLLDYYYNISEWSLKLFFKFSLIISRSRASVKSFLSPFIFGDNLEKKVLNVNTRNVSTLSVLKMRAEV